MQFDAVMSSCSVLPGLVNKLSLSAEKRAAESVAQLTVNQALGTPDWAGGGQEPSDVEKAGLMGLKVLGTVGVTAAVLLMPHVCIIPVICHQVASCGVAAGITKSVIGGMSSGLDDRLTKEITGNATPDPANRKVYTSGVEYLTKGLSMGSKALAGPQAAPQIAIAALGVGAVLAYDSAPEAASGTVGKIKNLFSNN